MNPQAKEHALDLLHFIDQSPSPWHAVKTCVDRLTAAGFKPLYETNSWSLEPNQRYFVVRDDSSMIAFTTGHELAEKGFQIIGAHTDSPGLRVKPKPDSQTEGIGRVGVEVYGGALIATFADRDLSIAGRVSYQIDNSLQSDLIHFETPLLRLPNLAIHMNPTVNEEGLKFDKQTELPLILSSASAQLNASPLTELISAKLNVPTEALRSWELQVFDTQKGVLYGQYEEFYANGQLDNLASCHAALSAFTEQAENSNFAVCAFFDHEEIGSHSHKGADGSFLSDVLERIANGLNYSAEDYKRSLANSFLISADMAHAYQPNFPNAYESDHHVYVNRGPVIKVNANVRYASNSASQAYFISLCEQANVSFQQYAHRTNLGCGSTIGPISSAQLGIQTIDVGNPMWAMHSARESAGVQDHFDLTTVFKHFFNYSA